jgi:hypothetical protein
MKLDDDGVTDTRYFSEEISTSRNADPYQADATACHHCKDKFSQGQMRYPIMTGVWHGTGWGLASVCIECFKVASTDETSTQERVQRDCCGCGEPMLTPLYGPYDKLVCSNRCYQRDYRRRRRGRDSVVDWKAKRPNASCAVCKKLLDQWGKQHKRKDAVYCSPR